MDIDEATALHSPTEGRRGARHARHSTRDHHRRQSSGNFGGAEDARRSRAAEQRAAEQQRRNEIRESRSTDRLSVEAEVEWNRGRLPMRLINRVKNFSMDPIVA